MSVIFNIDRDARPEHLGYGKFQNAPKGFLSMLAWVRKLTKPLHVPTEEWLFCCEKTGGYDHHLCNYLYGKGLDLWREDAIQIRRSMGLRRDKSDKADSLVIANYALRKQSEVKLYRPESKNLVDLRELFLFRQSLVRACASAKTRAKEKKATTTRNSVSTYIYRETMREVGRLEESIRECEERMLAVVRADEELLRNYNHITSIKGMGLVLGVAMIVFTGNFQKITDPNQFACYCGLVTFYDNSGTSVRHRDGTKNIKHKQLNAYLTIAAQSASRTDDYMKSYLERLLGKGKIYPIALNNVKHKIVHLAYALVRSDNDYIPGYKPVLPNPPA